VQQSSAELARQNAGSYYLDPVRVGAELANGERAVVRGAQNLGAAPDSTVTLAKIGELHNSFAATIVDRYLANNDPAGARAWLAAIGGRVTNSATAEALQGRIKSGLVQQGAREITAEVVGCGGDLWSSIKTAEGGVRPDGTAAVSPKGRGECQSDLAIDCEDGRRGAWRALRRGPVAHRPGLQRDAGPPVSARYARPLRW
jgi:hypothetical protein